MSVLSRRRLHIIEAVLHELDLVLEEGPLAHIPG